MRLQLNDEFIIRHDCRCSDYGGYLYCHSSIMSDRRQAGSTHTVIKTKYGGQCRYCDCHFPAGVPVYWSRNSGTYHLNCFNKE